MTQIRLFLLLMSVFFACPAEGQQTFRTAQLEHPRVKTAYNNVWPGLRTDLTAFGIGNSFKLFFQAFKAEGKLELWVKNPGEPRYRLFRTYAFCAHSGQLGPKVTEGDLQTPEGFYKIVVFNPRSTYHLSLGINYPNATDRQRSGARPPGGDIYIHGNCVTVGCIPLTDEKIEEVYVLAVEARSAGQTDMPVYIFPFRMGQRALAEQTKQWPMHRAFWNRLEPAYRYFKTHQQLPR